MVESDARRLVLLGGCCGIGRAVAHAALAGGWRVMMLDLAASIARHPLPSGIDAIALDLMDEEGVEIAFSRVKALFGGLDGFVSLSGIMEPMLPLADTQASSFDEVIAGNLSGAFHAAAEGGAGGVLRQYFAGSRRFGAPRLRQLCHGERRDHCDDQAAGERERAGCACQCRRSGRGCR